MVEHDGFVTPAAAQVMDPSRPGTRCLAAMRALRELARDHPLTGDSYPAGCRFESYTTHDRNVVLDGVPASCRCADAKDSRSRSTIDTRHLDPRS